MTITTPPFNRGPRPTGPRPQSSSPHSSTSRPAGASRPGGFSGPRPGGFGAPRPPRPAGPRFASTPNYEHNINAAIRAPEVRLIGADGGQVGVVSITEARRLAEEAGLDLVEVVATATPPVCKILDYGKFRFQEQKKAQEAKKNQVVIEVKEITLRPHIDDNDYHTKIRKMKEFLEDGDKVKVTLRFRGREMSHLDLGRAVLERILADLKELSKVEQPPKVEGRNMGMLLSSTVTKKK